MIEAYFGQNQSQRINEDAWVISTPAKVNLFLEVGDKRADGYHEVETLIAPISLSDRLCLRVTQDPAIVLYTQFPSRKNVRAFIDRQLPPPAQNLVTRVLREFQSETRIQRGAVVTLTKTVPLQAGLGGASSNAAFALRVANKLWRVDWPIKDLARWVAKFGSDIPFFLQDRWAICRGKGESVESLPSGRRCPLLIAAPPIGMPTAEVYSRHRPSQGNLSVQPVAKAIVERSSFAFGRMLWNRLQAPAAELSNWVQRLYRIFGRLPQIGHQMTGSGSCHFGLFSTIEAARTAGLKLKQQLPECRVILCELSPKMNF